MGDYKLVKRYCACKCGKSFMCMPDSKSIYFSEIHYPPEEAVKQKRRRTAKGDNFYEF